MKPRFVLLALTLLLAARLVAQEPEDRAVLEAFRDSLATVSDSNALAAVEHRLIEQARVDRDNALLHLRLGFLALRVGDLGAKRRYEAAASEFEWARDLQPRWPYPWYGLGLAELAIGEP